MMAFAARETLKSSVANSSLRSGWRAFALCLSFANLCFLNVWVELQDHEGDFFRTSTVTWTQLTAVTLDILILAGALWVPIVLAVSSGKRTLVRALKWCILAGLMVPMNAIRRDPYVIRRSGEILQNRNGRLAVGICAVALAAFLLVRWEKLSPLVVSVALTLLLPTFPLVVARTAWSVYSGPSGALPNKPLLPALPQPPGAPHVLWILFDEWDQRLTFDVRAAGLRLPQLDRFRSQSFYAGHAYPPAPDTAISVPSLLSGKTFTQSTPQGASEMLETWDPRQSPGEPLTAEPTIFKEARRAGFNVGVGGWYLPYCRLFGDFTTCLVARAEASPSPAGMMVATARDQFHALPLVPRLGIVKDLDVVEAIDAYRQIRRYALQSVLDPRLNLVFLHLNVPHPKFIYDAAKASFSSGQETTYPDNLALVDRILGEIRGALEQSGTWDRTTILLTSDHPLRLHRWRLSNQFHGRTFDLRQGTRVPFLLKMAGQKQGLAYDTPMRTVVTKDLLLAIMKGEITQPEQVARWLDRRPPCQ
jgi:hypothetical protein